MHEIDEAVMRAIGRAHHFTCTIYLGPKSTKRYLTYRFDTLRAARDYKPRLLQEAAPTSRMPMIYVVDQNGLTTFVPDHINNGESNVQGL